MFLKSQVGPSEAYVFLKSLAPKVSPTSSSPFSDTFLLLEEGQMCSFPSQVTGTSSESPWG